MDYKEFDFAPKKVRAPKTPMQEVQGLAMFDDFMASVYGKVSELGTVTIDYFKGKVREFQARATEFYNTYNSLVDKKPVVDRSTDPALKQQYSELMQRGQGVHSKTKLVTDKIKDATEWYRQQTGATSLMEVQDDRVLGAIPAVALVAVAAIGVCLMLITSWLKDAYEFKARLDKIEEYEKQGMSPYEAASATNAVLGAPSAGAFGFLKDVKTIAILGVVGLGIYFWMSRSGKK